LNNFEWHLGISCGCDYLMQEQARVSAPTSGCESTNNSIFIGGFEGTFHDSYYKNKY